MYSSGTASIFSVSIDAMINGLGILVISYFLYLYKKNQINDKELIIFSILCLLMGLCKLPYLALILLILVIPRTNLTSKQRYISYLSIVSLLAIGLIWYEFYASAAYTNSFRMEYMIRNHVNATLQLDYVRHNIVEFSIMLFNLPNYLYDTLLGLFTFSHNENIYTSNIITILLILFIGGLSLFYPLDDKFPKKVKIPVLIISMIIFIGTYLIQFFTWTPVGDTLIVGTQPRYFITLFALAPICFNLNKNESNPDLENYLLIFIMFFISATLLLIVFNFY